MRKLLIALAFVVGGGLGAVATQRLFPDEVPPPPFMASTLISPCYNLGATHEAKIGQIIENFAKQPGNSPGTWEKVDPKRWLFTFTRTNPTTKTEQGFAIMFAEFASPEQQGVMITNFAIDKEEFLGGDLCAMVRLVDDGTLRGMGR